MVVAALVFSGCMVVVFGTWTLLVWLALRRLKKTIMLDLHNALVSFVSSPDEGTPSPLAVYTDQAATLLAARLVQQVKAMLAGTESGLSKGEATERQLALMEGAPSWVSLLAGALPKRLRSQLMRNPQMVGALSNLLAPKNGGDGTSSAGSVRDRLKGKEG